MNDNIDFAPRFMVVGCSFQQNQPLPTLFRGGRYPCIFLITHLTTETHGYGECNVGYFLRNLE